MITNKKYYEIESCENNCERIKDLEQQKNTLEQYLRIEKEVSDETIKELEQQNKEYKEFLHKMKYNTVSYNELHELLEKYK